MSHLNIFLMENGKRKMEKEKWRMIIDDNDG
jgi:hypothetical protein